MKIILADDHALFRAGIRLVLAELDQNVTIIEAIDYPSLLAAVESNPDADLVLVDLNMPGCEPFICLRNLLSAHPTLLTVVLSATEDSEVMRQVLKLGAMGYIPKSENSNVMLSALRLVISGGIYVPPATLNSQNLQQSNSQTLTERQKEVLRELVNGDSNKEIAHRLGMSEATVKAHITAILRVLNASNRTQAVLQAEKLGII